MGIVVGVSLTAVLVLLTFAFFIWRLVSTTRVCEVNPEWIKNFSVAAYRPMERLLSEADVEFLKSHPGYEPKMGKALRSDRIRVFRAYLVSLGRDFNRLHLALRLTVLHSPEDRQDLATALIKQKLLFFAGLIAIHVKLGLYTLGVGTVDVRGLIATLDTMSLQLRGLIPAPVNASTI